MAIYSNVPGQGENLYQNVGKNNDDFYELQSVRVTDRFLVAVDIGASYFGYSFAPAGNPRDYTGNKNWASSFVAHKAPTAVCVSADNKSTPAAFVELQHKVGWVWNKLKAKLNLLFVFSLTSWIANYVPQTKSSIGYQAYNEFEQEYDRTDIPPGLVVEFKNKIRDQISDKKTRQRALNAMQILLQQIKEHAVKAISSKYNRRVTSEDITWIFPKSSDWTDNDCNKILRKAQKIGMTRDPGQIRLVPESHAAFIYCMSMRRPGDSLNKNILVITAGGENIELSLFELRNGSKVPGYKVKRDTCFGFGGYRINEYFINYLKEEQIFGKNFVDSCIEDRPAAWLDLMKQFEQAKQGSSPKSKASYTMQLGQSFGELFQLKKGKNLTAYLQQNPDLHINKSDGKLQLSNRKMKYFYQHVMYEFSTKLRELLGDTLQTNIIDKIFLTGGFASSQHLQDTVRQTFPSKPVIVPENISMCVANGCLMEGAGVVDIRR